MPRRLGWGAVDQGISSLTNVVVAVAVARSSSARDFGVFAVVSAAYAVVLSMSRALATQSLLVRFSMAAGDRRDLAARAATGAVVVMGLASGAVTALVGIAIGGPTGALLVALGIGFPGLLVQDAWRHVFFASGAPERAVVNDLVWLVGQTAAFVALGAAGAGPAGLVLAWGAAATVAAVLGAAQSGLRPAPRLAWAWWTDHRDLGWRFAGESLLRTGSQSATLSGIGAAAGLPAAGAARAAHVLFGPLHVLIQASALVVVPEAVRSVHRSAEQFERWCRRLSAVLMTLAGGYAATVLLIPDSAGRALLGPSWTGAETILVPVAVAYVGALAAVGPSTGLRALAAAREGLLVTAATEPLRLALVVGGAALGGLRLAALGGAAAAWLEAVVTWVVFHRTLLRRARGAPAAEPAAPGAGSAARKPAP